ncbi:LGFP repeat family [Verrucomicrobiia bacterium DG1235]|nr:LGFP repeat family [Verrucomicrobiae bacterium DG1235]
MKAVRVTPSATAKLSKIKPRIRKKITRLTPVQRAARAIEAKYKELGGLKSWLKKATISVTRCPDKVGYFRHYAGGSIYYHPETGAHAVKGAIRRLWAEQGWERGKLGYPTTDEERGRNADGYGRYSHFQGGAIFWKLEFGAIQLDGPIWRKYRDIGAEASPLGFPKQVERGTPDRRGRFVHFEYGSIYYTHQTGAWEVHGSIRGYWAQKGWERNEDLGYPISDELIPDRALGWRSPLVFSMAHAVLVSNAIRVNSTGTSGVGKTAVATFANKKKLTLNPVLAKKKVAASALVAKPLVMPKTVVETVDGEDSENRFSDFENGVLFWSRKDRKVTELAPWTRTSKGTSLRFSGSQIAAKVRGELNKLLKLPSCSLISVVYKSVGNYRFDGAGVSNRRHRLEATFRGSIVIKGKLQPTDLKLRLSVVVSWNPIHRTIDAAISGFSYIRRVAKMHGIGDTRIGVGKRLDPLLWQRFVIASVPAKDRSKNVAVLSVKTLSNGLVQVYREP